MSVPAFIFSRMDSRRLPGKALLDIACRPLLARVIDRVELSGATPVAVCTSDRPLDEPLCELAAAAGVEAFGGDTADVLGRALACAATMKAAAFVRISGDSPFIDPHLIDRMIAIHQSEKPDLTTNVSPRTFPPGISVEVIDTGALRRAAGLTVDAEDREHVTRYLYRHPADFTIRNERAEDDRYAGLSLSVDTPDDVDKATWIAERAADDAGLDEIAALARQYATLAALGEGQDR